MSDYAIGIDPGKHGAITFGKLHAERTEIVETFKMPKRPLKSDAKKFEIDEDAIHDLMRSLIRRGARHAFLEKIPKFAGENRSASHMAVLFGNAAFFHGLLLAMDGLDLYRFPPQQWMILLGLRVRPTDRDERKRMLLELTRSRFPTHKWTLETADAPLILEAGRLYLSRR